MAAIVIVSTDCAAVRKQPVAGASTSAWAIGIYRSVAIDPVVAAPTVTTALRPTAMHKAPRAGTLIVSSASAPFFTVTEIMTHRSKIVFLNAVDSDEVNWRKIVTSGHSQFPVYEGTRDHVLGMVSVKALWANAAVGVESKLRDHLTKPLFVPGSVTVVQLLESFKKTGKHIALITDEYGSTQGIVSLIDVMEAIVGDLPEPGDRRGPDAVQREDGTWLVEGGMSIDVLKQRFQFGAFPGEDTGRFETLGGFVLNRLGHVPSVGEAFEWGGWRFEVMDMDRHRVDKLLLQQRGSLGTIKAPRR